ncbi:hypothetical protein GN244_ATG10743 [Phytophthora infestans]|uniref:Uncharacterized protein n=1 Tax=Phytophthora infestans TaxID=4787 RepID=A0A833TA50_PHYIN|nr:hypothetical protein GN244_ATG10743 [Phytophthora infestans]
MSGLTTKDAAPSNKINWLKGLPDGDKDASDATPQRKEQESLNADRKLKKKVHKARSITRGDTVKQARQESDKNRYRQEHDGADRDDVLGERSTGSVVSQQHDSLNKELRAQIHTTSLSRTETKRGEKRNRRYLEGKAVKKQQRKRLHANLEMVGVASAKEKAVGLQLTASIDTAKAKAAALRQRRMRKLQARRKATGEYERLAAVKLKRLESSKATRLKRNQREQMRKAQKAPAAAATDEEGSIHPRSAPLFTKEPKEQKKMLERQSDAAKKHLGGLKLTSISALKHPQTASSEKKRQKRKSDLLRTFEHRAGGLRQKRLKLEFVRNNAKSVAGGGITIVKSPNKRRQSSLAYEKRSEDVSVVEDPHEHEARPSGDVKTAEGPERQEKPKQNEELCRRKNIREEVKEEGQVDSPDLRKSLSADVNPQGGSEKTSRHKMNDMALDMAPIPRKHIKDAASATSFVIPKRLLINTDGHVKARGESSHHDPKLVGAKIPAVNPVSPLKSCPRLSSRDPIRSQGKRTKAPVPMKNSMLSTHDIALMRLARKRNSVFLAATELAQPSLVDIKVSAARLTGYDIFDADGKVLLDLVPRWSCATKHEMIANMELFTTSFSGVSLAAPKAKETNSRTAEVSALVGGRMMNCYEELRFQRPEDREFYQRHMYGAAFVPQYLRGRATLIARCVCFERKSTGIRFNQDRDREEFAASLSRRYTFKKSTPRCEIRREHWQKMMRNQPSVVYLHYNNIEDAERASHIFRDDAGNAIELKPDHKSCAGSGRGFISASGNGYRMPRRSCSSERSPPKSFMQSTKGGSVLNNPHWQLDHYEATNRYSGYGRPSSPQRNGIDGRYNPSVSGYSLRSRSRSRSRPKLFSDQQHDSVGKGNGDEIDNVAVAVGTSISLSPKNPLDELPPCTRKHLTIAKGGESLDPQDPNGTSKGNLDEDTDVAMAERSASPRTTSKGPCKQDLESGEEEQEEGEIETSIELVPTATDPINGTKRRRCSRSPRKSWKQRNAIQSRQRQEDCRGRSFEQNWTGVMIAGMSRNAAIVITVVRKTMITASTGMGERCIRANTVDTVDAIIAVGNTTTTRTTRV